MERIIVNQGTKTPLYKVFEDLQNYTKINDTRKFNQLIEAYGVNVATISSGVVDPTDTGMLVTSVNGQSFVSVAAGDGITANFDYVSVSPGTTVSVASLSDSTHRLYIKRTPAYSEPVDVMSGFAFAVSGIAGRNSREHDSIQFVWDTNPVGSGLALADVIVGGGVITSTTVDRRNLNILKLNRDILPDVVVRADRSAVQTLTGGIKTPSLEGTGSVPLTLSSGITSVTLTTAQLQDLLSRAHTQNTDIGTTSAYFKVGNSSALANDGSLVSLVPSTPKAPKAIRITNVTPATSVPHVDETMRPLLADPVRTGLITNEAKVSLKWNYDDITGQGINSTTFTISNCGGLKTWVANELTDYHLQIGSLDYAISSNTATNGATCNLVVTPYGHVTNISGLQCTNTSYGIIHSHAQKYEVAAISVNNDTEDDGTRVETTARFIRNNVPVMQEQIRLPIGAAFNIYVKAVTDSAGNGLYSLMPAGTYTKLPPFETVQTYDSPYLVRLPSLDSKGASIGATASTFGFIVTITGWDIATDFELCWTTDPGGPNFTNDTHSKMITRQRTIDIPTSASRQYYVAVRPLMGGQAVADPIIVGVVSGGGGWLPTDAFWGPIDIRFKTYAGTLTVVSSNIYQVTACTSPASGGTNDTLSQSVIGDVIRVNGSDYIISNVYTNSADTTYKTYIAIKGFDSGLPTSGLTGLTFTIGTTEIGRELYRVENIPLDVQVTKIHVEMFGKSVQDDSVVNPVLRWYQASRKDLADSVVLSQAPAGIIEAVTNVNILASNGTRTLIVDLYDESGGDNNSGFNGRITIFWRQFGTGGGLPPVSQDPPATA